MEHRPLWFVLSMKKADMKEKEEWFNVLKKMFGSFDSSKSENKKEKIVWKAPRKIPDFLLRPGSRFKDE